MLQIKYNEGSLIHVDPEFGFFSTDYFVRLIEICGDKVNSCGLIKKYQLKIYRLKGLHCISVFWLLKHELKRIANLFRMSFFKENSKQPEV